jgi:hypothetical protein
MIKKSIKDKELFTELDNEKDNVKRKGLLKQI